MDGIDKFNIVTTGASEEEERDIGEEKIEETITTTSQMD